MQNTTEPQQGRDTTHHHTPLPSPPPFASVLHTPPPPICPLKINSETSHPKETQAAAYVCVCLDPCRTEMPSWPLLAAAHRGYGRAIDCLTRCPVPNLRLAGTKVGAVLTGRETRNRPPSGFGTAFPGRETSREQAKRGSRPSTNYRAASCEDPCRPSIHRGGDRGRPSVGEGKAGRGCSWRRREGGR